METKDEVEAAKALEDPALAKNKLEGNIEFINVKFKYPERDAIVLKNFSLKINKGEKIAFVGSSGSGKSTIVQILMRFYPIEEGQILMDGHDVNKYNLHRYRGQIGLVSQEPTLFLGTIKDNIVYNSKIKKEVNAQVNKYCDVANATAFINEWPESKNIFIQNSKRKWAKKEARFREAKSKGSPLQDV